MQINVRCTVQAVGSACGVPCEVHEEMEAYNSGRAGSSTFSTLSTAMGDRRLEYCETTLLLNDLQATPCAASRVHACCQVKRMLIEASVAHVVAAWIRAFLSSRSTGVAISCKICTHKPISTRNERLCSMRPIYLVPYL